MQTRHLGALEVSALGLGCMGMSQSYGAHDDETSAATLRRAVELGVTLFDTANVYGSGHNEELLGRVLQPHRARIALATKVGLSWAADGTLAVDARPERIRAECEASLRRLRTEVIDLYYLHRPDPAVPVAESIGAMAELVRRGLVRHLGVSEFSAVQLREACAVHPIAALQSEYSLWTRDVEAEILPACRELGVGFVPFSPLGRGMLTGAIVSAADFGAGDMRAGFPRFSGDNLAHNLALVHRLEALAAARGVAPAQLALAWVMAQGPDIVPIPGTRRIDRLEANLAAADITLAADELQAIADCFPQGAVAGARYPKRLIATQP